MVLEYADILIYSINSKNTDKLNFTKIKNVCFPKYTIKRMYLGEIITPISGRFEVTSLEDSWPGSTWQDPNIVSHQINVNSTTDILFDTAMRMTKIEKARHTKYWQRRGVAVTHNYCWECKRLKPRETVVIDTRIQHKLTLWPIHSIPRYTLIQVTKETLFLITKNWGGGDDKNKPMFINKV